MKGRETVGNHADSELAGIEASIEASFNTGVNAGVNAGIERYQKPAKGGRRFR